MNGKAKEIPLRQGSNTAAHIDTLTFSFTKEVLIDHETPLDDKRTGKTFYVGTPNSSRLVRVYDKGCEQGDNTNRWVRFELQLRNRDYIIPHDILINSRMPSLV